VAVLGRKESTLIFKENVLTGRIEHITSAHILHEVEAVLHERLKLTKQKAKIATRLLARQSTIVEPTAVEKVCRDPFDDYILAAAHAGKVKYIVTSDNDLLVLNNYKGIGIITSSAFVTILNKT
jgi:putative PIN family toxin of toxin-antitoxin system